MTSIYLDHNATTPPSPEVVAAMHEALAAGPANPSSTHPAGQAARHRVEQARRQVAALLNVEPGQVVFTSGGTESIHLALRGAARALRCGAGQASSIPPNATAADPAVEQRKAAPLHVITTTVEHSAVLHMVESLQEEGCIVHRVRVDGDGCLVEADFRAALQTVPSGCRPLVSLLHAHNETGVLLDVPRFAAQAHEAGALIHVDAVQSAGKVPIDADRWPVHLISLSAHKFHGPTGVGALYVRRGTPFTPLPQAATQEHGLRPGTQNVPGIVGMGVAAEQARHAALYDGARIAQLRDAFEAHILHNLPCAQVIARPTPRVCNTSCIAFHGLDAQTFLIALAQQGVYASAGAACASGALEPSHALLAMHLPQATVESAIRFSLSRFTTPADLTRAQSAVCTTATRFLPRA